MMRGYIVESLELSLMVSFQPFDIDLFQKCAFELKRLSKIAKADISLLHLVSQVSYEFFPGCVSF